MAKKKPSPYQILPTADARRIVKPIKPQPAKSPNDKGGPFGIAPPVKPPVKPIAVKPPPKAPKVAVAPPAGQPPPDQGPPQQSFEDFLAGLFGNQGGQPQAPQQSFQDFISQFFQPQQQPDYGAIMKQLFAPVQQEYQSQLGSLSQFNGAQSEAVKSFTSQLVNQLQGLGDSVYTPELAGALGLEQQRETGWSQYQNQQKLYDSLVGGFQKDLPDLFSKLVDQYGPQQPSTSDLVQLRKLYDDENPQQGAGGLDPSTVLSALNAYNSTYGSPFDQQKLGFDETKYADSKTAGATKAANDQQTKDLALIALYQKQGLPLPPALAKKYGIGSKLPPTTDQKIAIQKAKDAFTTSSRNYNVAVAKLKQTAWYQSQTVATQRAALAALNQYRSGSLKIGQENADTAVARVNANIAKFNATQKSAAAKAMQPNASLSSKVGYLVDSNGNPLMTKNGKIQVLPGFTLKGGKVVKVAAAAKTSTLTASQKAKFRGTALQVAEDAHLGGKDPDTGQNVDPLSYRDAIRRVEQEGIPFSIALAAVNRYYKPGDRGRPYPNNVYTVTKRK